LERLLGVRAREVRGERDAPGQRFDTLALAVEEQSLEVDPGPPRRLGLREIGCESRGVLAEPSQNLRAEVGGERLHDPLES